MIKFMTFTELEGVDFEYGCHVCPIDCDTGRAKAAGFESDDCDGGHFVEVPNEFNEAEFTKVPEKDLCSCAGCYFDERQCPHWATTSKCLEEGVIYVLTSDLEPVPEEPREEDYACIPEEDALSCEGCAFYYTGDGCPSWANECIARGVIYVKESDPEEALPDPEPTDDDAEEIAQPDRYMWRGTESLPFCLVNKVDTVQNNVVKYIYRYPKKGGKQALEKACVYLKQGIQYTNIEDRPEVPIDNIVSFITSNNFTWREGGILICLLLGDYQGCLERVELLIEETYGTEEG